MTERRLKHEERRDDLAAYALGALDASGAADLEAHVTSCETCAEYLRWLQPAVDLLPASVEQVEPPESLRVGLMEAVRADVAEAAHQSGQAPTADPTPVGGGRRRWSLGGFALRPATVLAAVAVLAAGLAVGYVLSDSGDPQRQFVKAEAVGSVSPAALAANLEHGAGGDAILHVERAPAPAKGDVYQAWVSRDGTMEPVASFTPHADGTAEAALGDSLEGADAVLVTEEPSPDQESPTSAPILRASLG